MSTSQGSETSFVRIYVHIFRSSQVVFFGGGKLAMRHSSGILDQWVTLRLAVVGLHVTFGLQYPLSCVYIYSYNSCYGGRDGLFCSASEGGPEEHRRHSVLICETYL